MKNSMKDSKVKGIELRHESILNILKNNGSATVGFLSESLGVSVVTIRKDLTILEDENKLYRSHGKAKLINPYTNNRHVSEKMKIKINEKTAIANYAAKAVTDGDSIIIASGTTVLEFARAIETLDLELTVITSSLQVASTLSQIPKIKVIQLGGILRPSSVSVVGSHAEKMLQQFSCSKLYIGVDGIDPEFGLTTTDSMEASLNAEMIRAVQKVIVLSDSSKFLKRGLSKICNFDDVDQVITDSGVSSHIQDKLDKMGVDVVVLDCEDKL